MSTQLSQVISSLYTLFISDHSFNCESDLAFPRLLLTMPITGRNKRNRVAAFDPEAEEQENTLASPGNGAYEVKKEYERHRNRLLSILEPGDHIAAKRKKGIYEHHG